MCFRGPSGPSAAEQAAAEAQRQEAEERKQEELAERARTKQADITEALSGRTIRSGRRGGASRRSLFTSMSGGAGYASRF
jgi:hypothetical protein